MHLAPWLLLLAPAGGQDELLPATPDGWRYERLELPLDFAPEIELTGFEELRFAPGMFVPDSDSYFSYALAIRIDRVRVDEEFLEGFFQKYYAGLCRSVALGRGLELDLDSIRTSVEFDGRDFVASITMFDAFVTAKPLVLRLEISVHASPRATELFGIASPLPREAAIWRELEAIRTRWRAARPAPALLNHVYFVPDADTYAALAGSKELASFAPNETRTTVRSDLTYTGRYFYCHDTYFEFLSPSERFPAGSSGVAFGFEHEGASEVRAQALRERGLEAFVGPVTRALDGEQVPWFRMLSVARGGASPPLDLFALEYDPSFLARWHPPPEGPEQAGISRRAVLERYCDVLGQARLREWSPFTNVIKLNLALDAAERKRLSEVCESFGYEVEHRNDTLVCVGPDVTLFVSAAEPSLGLTAIWLGLRHPRTGPPLELGRARLVFNGPFAVLELGR